jgi:tetratricopeptide (TPR) repeat protein
MVALVNLASMVTAIDGAAPGARAFDEAIAFAESHGLPTEDARTGRLGAMMDAGQWDELLQEADLLLAWARRHGDAYTEVAVRLASARVRLERGEAIGPQDALAGMARDTGWVPPSTAPIQAEAALAAHDRRSARDALASAIDTTEAGQFFNDASFVRACLRVGALDLARRALEIGSTPALGVADRALAMAMVAQASGDYTSARAGYEQVVPELARLGHVPEQAYAVAGLGRCLLALGDTERGIELLLEARATWERLRATPRIAEIEALLAAAPTA